MMKNYILRFKVLTLILVGFLTTPLWAADISNGLKLHYTFENSDGITVPDVSGNGYAGTLQGATTGITNGKPSLILGTSGSAFLDMGANTGNLVATLNDFSMSVYVYVNTTNTNLNANGNFICVLANSANSGTDQNGILFLQAKRSRYAISATYWNAEQFAQTGQDVVKGQWVHLTYTQAGTTGRMYVNGELKSTNPAITLTPSSLGATAFNFLGKPTYSGDLFLQDAQLSDFRIYNRAITSEEILILNGYPADLIEAYSALTMPNLNEVRSNITLPATSGTASLPVVWESSVPATISTTGEVTRPDKYDVTVKLTATLNMESNGTIYTLKKEFIAIVKAFTEMDQNIAKWDFTSENIYTEDGVRKVKDASSSAFVGTIMNEARIRTIGQTQQFNVLDLGNATGYFDMGEEIGKAIYALNDYTISGFFRIDEDYAYLGDNGNFMYVFSNTPDAPTDRNGYLLGRLNNASHEITPGYYATANEGVYTGSQAPKGAWHHFAYSQSGTTGKVFIDGVEAKTGVITNLPSVALPKAGLTGTKYNWIGRPNYPSDVYLRKTLIYDFQVYTIPLTQDNFLLDFEVPATLDQLNAAYTENPDFIEQAVVTEAENLTLGNLDAVTANLTLPTVGTTDPAVTITWSSSHEQIISNAGVVNRPDYFNFKVDLTATVAKGTQVVTKTFPATVVVKEGTQFAGDLMFKYDFSKIDGRFVKDVAEKQFTGMTVNEATTRKIGSTGTGFFDVLDLGNGTGYFDMGEEVGKVMYGLNDFTMSAFYRVDTAYHSLNDAGNFLWTFSNSTNSGVDANGYFFSSLKDLGISITPGYWSAASGNQALSFLQPALQGGWHNLTYTQSGAIGTIYIDGMAMVTGDITNTPKTALPKPGRLGSLYNWIGRSCYAPDAYLRQTLVYDIRMYNRALLDIEVFETVINANGKIGQLDLAYEANSNVEVGVKPVLSGPYKLTTGNGTINILGLEGNEQVSLYDFSGRRLKVTNNNQLQVTPGLYIVKINNYSAKVIVR